MDFLCVGKIVKPQGIKGEVKILPLVDIPAIFNGKHKLYLDKREAKCLSCTYRLGFAYAKFAEIKDRNMAEKYRNVEVFIEKEDFYKIPSNFVLTDDIIGEQIYDENGDYVGQIQGVDNFGFDDVIVIKDGDERIYQVPFVGDIFKSAGGKMFVIRKEYEGAKTDYEN